MMPVFLLVIGGVGRENGSWEFRGETLQKSGMI